MIKFKNGRLNPPLGFFPEHETKDGKVFNTCTVYNPQGPKYCCWVALVLMATLGQAN